MRKDIRKQDSQQGSIMIIGRKRRKIRCGLGRLPPLEPLLLPGYNLGHTNKLSFPEERGEEFVRYHWCLWKVALWLR